MNHVRSVLSALPWVLSGVAVGVVLMLPHWLRGVS